MIGLLSLSFIVIIFIAVFYLWLYVEKKHAKQVTQMYDDDLKRLREQGIIK